MNEKDLTYLAYRYCLMALNNAQSYLSLLVEHGVLDACMVNSSIHCACEHLDMVLENIESETMKNFNG